MIEKIEHEGKVFAMILRSDSHPKETRFFTPADFPFQLGFLKYQKGGLVEAHTHNPLNKTVNKRQEVLFIRKGRVEATFYTREGKEIKSTTLGKGDIILLADGGHGFKILEDAEIIEVKQGPYTGVETDKEDLKVD